ncbi:MAG: hypothetical protein WCT39_03265 [Candidatus Margulisiibacteriota bacterium]
MKRITALIIIVATVCFTGVGFDAAYAIVRRGRTPMIAPQLEPLATEPVVAKPLGSDHPKRVGPRLPRDTDIGVTAGIFAGLPSLAGEIRFKNFLDMDTASAKLGVRYAQGDDADKVLRKYALVFADGVVDLSAGPGAILYVAGGVNYLAYTTGKKPGTFGGEAYLGMREGGLYAEAGYGTIRTGFSPSSKGLILSVGFKHRY